EVTFVNTNDDSTPFSFLKYIFWNSSIDMNTITGRQIFKHEVAHIQEKHTYDKLFVNIALIFFWCNPFFWLYRKELNMIHEFIADKKAVEDGDTAAFAHMILQTAYPKHRFELTNNFFYSPIKRRLMMLNMKQNKKANYLNQWFALPLMLLVFIIFSCKAKDSDLLGKQEPQVNKVLTDSSIVNLKNVEEPIPAITSNDDNKIFVRAEVDPQFIGGEAAWRKYLVSNLNALVPVDKGAGAGKYTVIVKFIVNSDGSIRNVTCEIDPGFGTCDEAIRVIKKATRWTPAIQNGKNVNAYKKQPITFLVED
ncbi:MAG: M56 family metallopeptidase, partial [Ferruginibacter sp.]